MALAMVVFIVVRLNPGWITTNVERNSQNFPYKNNLKTKHIEQKYSVKLFSKHSFCMILNTWFNPTGEFLGEPGNSQVIKNWQSHKYTE